jgi:hypothetical protein
VPSFPDSHPILKPLNSFPLKGKFRELRHKDFLSKLKGAHLFYFNKETRNAILVFKISYSGIWQT